MRDLWDEPEARLRAHPALRYIVWVYVALGVLLAGMIALVALDDANAQYYIDAFQTLLSWPVLAFSLVMIVLLIFHRDLANVFKGYYISRVGRDAVHFERKTQPDPPADERPIRSAGDVVPQPTPQPAADISENAAYLRGYDDGWKQGLAAGREELESWEQEANHWWRRYLAVFLTPATQQILKSIGTKPRTILDFEQLMNNAREREQLTRSGAPTGTLETLLRTAESIPPVTPLMLAHALNALAQYDLVQRTGEGDAAIYEITADGRDFLAFLSSPEGEEFVREALAGRSSDVQ